MSRPPGSKAPTVSKRGKTFPKRTIRCERCNFTTKEPVAYAAHVTANPSHSALKAALDQYSHETTARSAASAEASIAASGVQNRQGSGPPEGESERSELVKLPRLTKWERT